MERLQTTERHESQRGYFAHALYNEMCENPDIFLVVADLGYKVFDRIQTDFPERFINVGAAEQAAVGISVGLAQEGRVPFVYSITPFLLYRPFETIRNYLEHEQVPVKLVGSGRDKDYKHDGFSHWAEEDKFLFASDIPAQRMFNNIEAYWPRTQGDISQLLHNIITNGKPTYINLTR